MVPERKGELYQIAQTITELGGNIITLGTFWGDDAATRLLTLRVSEVTQEELVAKMEEIGAKVIDARACQAC
jgi:acetoin utilization protein AcuB